MKYTEGYVAFIDILGFSKFIEIEENGENTFDLFGFVKRFCRLFNSSNKLNVNVAFFSDSIIMTTSNINNLFIPIWLAENYLKDNLGLLFRGGITYGKYYHSDNIAFGPAIIKAYELEQQAKYSRIIIDKNLNVKEDINIYKDDDFYCINLSGTTFLGALRDIKKTGKYNDCQVNNHILSCLNKERQHICKQIRKYADTAVRDKYLWRIKVFNYTCTLIEKDIEEYYKAINVDISIIDDSFRNKISKMKIDEHN